MTRNCGFAQAEAQFTTRRVTAEGTEYAHIVGSLSKEYASEVRDMLPPLPSHLPYPTLRDALIKRVSDSDSSKLQQQLSSARLGDQKPSQLLRHMQRLVGAKALDPSMLRQLLFQRLPNIVLVLEATSSSMSLEKAG